jgi:hypothetical protein
MNKSTPPADGVRKANGLGKLADQQRADVGLRAHFPAGHCRDHRAMQRTDGDAGQFGGKRHGDWPHQRRVKWVRHGDTRRRDLSRLRPRQHLADIGSGAGDHDLVRRVNCRDHRARAVEQRGRFVDSGQERRHGAVDGLHQAPAHGGEIDSGGRREAAGPRQRSDLAETVTDANAGPQAEPFAHRGGAKRGGHDRGLHDCRGIG